MTTELWKVSAAQLSEAYRSGELLPSTVAEVVLTHAEMVQAKLNLFTVLDKDGARKAAAESDRRWNAGAPLGQLDGVPITVKDNIPVKGLPCVWGSALYLGRISERDELPVARLRSQGVVILGKTTCSEFGLGRGNTSTSTFGVREIPEIPNSHPVHRPVEARRRWQPALGQLPWPLTEVVRSAAQRAIAAWSV